MPHVRGHSDVAPPGSVSVSPPDMCYWKDPVGNTDAGVMYCGFEQKF